MSRLSFRCQHTFTGGFALDVAFQADQLVTALFGPSGSGKTSVLSILAGFLNPRSGQVLLDDRPLLDTEKSIHVVPERRQIGMVYQDHLLFPHMTVEGNLRYGRKHRRRPFRRIESARVIEVLEIGSLLRRYPRNLSGGERQRVALGRALLSGPELLLMDEPLAALDTGLKARILAYLERVVEEWQVPVVYVTHSQTEVRRLADWVVVMEAGRVVTGGKPDDALSRPEPLGWKNSTGPANLLRVENVEVLGDHAVGRVGGQLLHLPLPESADISALYVAFQPADVTLSRTDVEGISARNHLTGTVLQVTSIGQAVFVAIDIGQVIWVEITENAAAELGLVVGAGVTCLLKTHSLQIVT